MRFSDIVIDDAKLSLAAKGAFTALGLVGNGCSIEELAARTRDDEVQVRSALDELVKAGYIELVDDTVHIQSAGTFGVNS